MHSSFSSTQSILLFAIKSVKTRANSDVPLLSIMPQQAAENSEALMQSSSKSVHDKLITLVYGRNGDIFMGYKSLSYEVSRQG